MIYSHTILHDISSRIFHDCYLDHNPARVVNVYFQGDPTYFSVVDVYQEWSGPVKPLIANLRRLKNELGDDKLRFLVVS